MSDKLVLQTLHDMLLIFGNYEVLFGTRDLDGIIFRGYSCTTTASTRIIRAVYVSGVKFIGNRSA